MAQVHLSSARYRPILLFLWDQSFDTRLHLKIEREVYTVRSGDALLSESTRRELTAHIHFVRYIYVSFEGRDANKRARIL